MQKAISQLPLYSKEEIEKILGVSPWKSQLFNLKVFVGITAVFAFAFYLKVEWLMIISSIAWIIDGIIVLLCLLPLWIHVKRYYASRNKLLANAIHPDFYINPKAILYDTLVADAKNDLLMINGELFPLSSLNDMNWKAQNIDFWVTLKFRTGDIPVKKINLFNNKAEAEYQRLVNYLGW